MQFVHMLQIAAVVGAALFFLSGLLVQRRLGRSNAGTQAPRSSGSVSSGVDQVSLLHEAVARLEFELQDSRARQAEAEANLRAMKDLVRSTGGNARSSPRSPKAQRQADDQLSAMQSALAELEQALSEKQQLLQDAREKMAAMEEMLRQRER